MQRNMMIAFVGIWCILASMAVEPAAGLANCPPGCQCDDNTLVVQCGEGQLDVLPIALNPSIQRLVIKSNKIKTIDSSIQFYAELTFLDLSSNHLMTIPQRTFAYQKKLQEVHLNHNKIGQISNKTFIGLSAVTVLNLRGNQISELHQGTFTPLLKVEELNLGENRIGYLDPKAFDGLSQLRILYLDDNALTSVPDPVIFQAMPSLAELFLGMNTLQSIQAGAFQDLKGLTRLELKGASLRNISHDSFLGLEELRILDLSDNRLDRIPSVGLSKLVRLEQLSLGQNDFEVISEGAFLGLKQLKRLEVNGALKLKRVMTGAFSDNANLEYLNLSSNKMLVEVQEGALSGLPHLRHVMLKANALTSLAEGLFPWKDLLTLDLSENPLSCDCRVMWLHNLLVAKNASQEEVSELICEFPERLRGESLRHLNPALMGCTHADPRKQALIGALLVGSAATITALALVIYRCRHKIRETIKGGGGLWGNSALGRKEREYQKTFCDEDYMSRHQHHPCSLGIHSTFPNTYTAPHHPGVTHHYGMCPMPAVNDLGAVDPQQKFQQLAVSTMVSEKKLNNNKGLVSQGAVDDSASFVLHMKSATMGRDVGHQANPQLNHYTKPQFLAATATVGDSCYSYADVPMVHGAPLNQPQLRLTQEHFKQRELYDQEMMGGEILDHNYIYSNTHYSMPLEQLGRSKTPTPPPMPPALPLRNGLCATTGRRSFQQKTAAQKQQQQQQQNNNTLRQFTH
ncbi:leucine-rich repeat and immunoglobulin-like domain containing-NOGO receptor-interacting protein 4 [Drosophila takahashii]|uniref:leucine-rich repeat and immunoglobulin-like domain containing-NOGO receptor-interacting protein 4 n=1 Tax=Drosophila takahashii TaxID=29030 RepID=UPI001CF7FD03|nr:leucine-rich repeat-containing protein 15 [Drosophila takahashii]